MSIEMTLNGKQKRKLRALAHPLKAVVQIGQRGVTEAVAHQVDSALTDHELIKVRLGAEAPMDRKEAAQQLAPRAGCEVAGTVGRVLILYRPHPDQPRIRLDDAGGEATNLEPEYPVGLSEEEATWAGSIEEEPA
jgi:RNA-binding protein